eukprot:TRINITY_DN2774_c0_g1_i2.p1 TRINITY_DN2774_c0_g1~~TRINITY_DN2774_c0_g1_i2.p1  ORF type:complete len:367 (-),score=68.02 TRINITY_DN2774_c0_g1_i2:7-1050(-)
MQPWRSSFESYNRGYPFPRFEQRAVFEPLWPAPEIRTPTSPSSIPEVPGLPPPPKFPPRPHRQYPAPYQGGYAAEIGYSNAFSSFQPSAPTYAQRGPIQFQQNLSQGQPQQAQTPQQQPTYATQPQTQVHQPHPQTQVQQPHSQTQVPQIPQPPAPPQFQAQQLQLPQQNVPAQQNIQNAQQFQQAPGQATDQQKPFDVMAAFQQQYPEWFTPDGQLKTVVTERRDGKESTQVAVMPIGALANVNNPNSISQQLTYVPQQLAPPLPQVALAQQPQQANGVPQQLPVEVQQQVLPQQQQLQQQLQVLQQQAQQLMQLQQLLQQNPSQTQLVAQALQQTLAQGASQLTL